jgi:hypothetical protein
MLKMYKNENVLTRVVRGEIFVKYQEGRVAIQFCCFVLNTGVNISLFQIEVLWIVTRLVSYHNTKRRHNSEEIDLKHHRENLKVTLPPFICFLYE